MSKWICSCVKRRLRAIPKRSRHAPATSQLLFCAIGLPLNYVTLSLAVACRRRLPSLAFACRAFACRRCRRRLPLLAVPLHTGNESEVELKGTAGTLSLAERATAACTCAYDTTSSCNFQANHSIPITVTKAVTSAGTTEVDTQTIAFTSSYSCNDNGTCGHSVPYTCLTGTACSAFTVQDMTLTGNTLTLTQTSSDGSNNTTTPETFTLSRCWQ